jgi:hypothetical protein
MVYQPKVLFNPSDKDVEFKCRGISYFLKSKESKLFDGYIAEHALKRVNTGFVEYNPEEHVEESTSIDYSAMPWKKLVSLGAQKGVFSPGMQRKALEEALANEEA